MTARSSVADERVLDARFRAVGDLFEECLRDRPDAGAAVCVYLDGRPVVDLWGGPTWSHRTSQVVFSASKGALALCLGLLVEQQRIAPDDPVSRHWPEFAAGGKEQVTVRQVMAHEAGLPTVDGGFDLADLIAHEPLVRRLAEQVPLWEPGTAHGYHAATLGTLGRELVRRTSGTGTSEFFSEQVAQPLGLDFWFGVPPEHQGSVGRLRPPRAAVSYPEVELLQADPQSLQRRVLPREADVLDFTRPAVRDADLPAVTGVATARALARMYAACVGEVDGLRLLSPSTLEAITQPGTEGPDLVGLEPSRFGMGFQLPFPRLPFAGEGSFGHDGHGGAYAFGHAGLGLGFGFLTDQMPDFGGADPFALRLADAVLDCLGQEPARAASSQGARA
jgi:CubicO group peptidase (beta-lactamase class C family)